MGFRILSLMSSRPTTEVFVVAKQYSSLIYRPSYLSYNSGKTKLHFIFTSAYGCLIDMSFVVYASIT